MTTPPTTTTRLKPADLEILKALQAKLGISRTDVIRIAVRLLAEREGVRLEGS